MQLPQIFQRLVGHYVHICLHASFQAARPLAQTQQEGVVLGNGSDGLLLSVASLVNQLRRPNQGRKAVHPLPGAFSGGHPGNFSQAKGSSHLLQVHFFLPGALLRRAVEDSVGRRDSVRVPSGNLGCPKGVIIGHPLQRLQNLPVSPDAHGKHPPIQGICRQSVGGVKFIGFSGEPIQADVQVAEAGQQQRPLQVKHCILRKGIVPVRGIGGSAGAYIAE